MPLPLLRMDVKGMQKLQAARLKLMIAINPKGGLGKAVKEATIVLFRYAQLITHVQTGSLRASHTMNFGAGRLTTTFGAFAIRSEAIGHIEIGPRTVNPITKEKPVEYGPAEHAKGGPHEFYARTVRERGNYALTVAHRVMMRELPQSSVLGSFLGGARSTSAVNLLDVLS